MISSIFLNAVAMALVGFNAGVSATPYCISLGCYSDSSSARILGITAQVIGGSSAVTPETCEIACAAAGYFLAGVENGSECYCGSAIINGGKLATDNGCTKTCAGNSKETCGGTSRINLYACQPTLCAPVASASTTVKTTTSTTMMTSTTKSTTSTTSSKSTTSTTSTSIKSTTSTTSTSSKSTTSTTSKPTTTSTTSKTSSTTSSSTTTKK